MRKTWGENPLQPKGFYKIPVVRSVILATVAAFLVYFLASLQRETIGQALWFIHPGGTDPSWLYRPWTLLTHPLLIPDPISLLLSCYWLYVCGGMLERSWGSVNFAVMLAAYATASALGLLAGSALLGAPILLGGMLLLGSACLVSWAAMDPDQELSVWGLIRVPLKYLALADTLFVYFTYGLRSGAWGPVLGFFALTPLALAWLYVRKLPRLNLAWGGGRRPDSYRKRTPAVRARGWDAERIARTDPKGRQRSQEEIETLRRLLGEHDD